MYDLIVADISVQQYPYGYEIQSSFTNADGMQSRYLFPRSNEPSSRACTDIWRMPRGSNTPQLCCAANLIYVIGILSDKVSSR